MQKVQRPAGKGPGEVHVSGQRLELPLCPVCGFVYVPEELAVGKVLAVEKALEDK